jgi:hypothetical protein
MTDQPITEGVWTLEHGNLSSGPRGEAWRENMEDLTYSNPFGQEVERVWFDGKVVFATELGEVEVDLDKVKVAQEYQVVYNVDLGEGREARPRAGARGRPVQHLRLDTRDGEVLTLLAEFTGDLIAAVRGEG